MFIFKIVFRISVVCFKTYSFNFVSSCSSPVSVLPLPSEKKKNTTQGTAARFGSQNLSWGPIRPRVPSFVPLCAPVQMNTKDNKNENDIQKQKTVTVCSCFLRLTCFILFLCPKSGPRRRPEQEQANQQACRKESKKASERAGRWCLSYLVQAGQRCSKHPCIFRCQSTPAPKPDPPSPKRSLKVSQKLVKDDPSTVAESV